jgi:site-specific DNA recombinase
VLADIYADEAITGTQVTKREDFQRMINEWNGDIDMVITKSISRFARNTLDTLKYVRMLKERDIAVYFEDEKINTLTMDGELLLVVLSSVAQQEVENISANVKKGLKMKKQRGELVGFQGCLGYDYHPEDKSISINEKEAEIVRYIFQRYVGKTFTLDPISKRRLENFGEEDQYYLRNHHEPIVSAEIFDKAQEIRMRRNRGRNTVANNGGKREKFSRKYAFSCMIDCAYCGSTLTRRRWHSGTKYGKTIWQCVTSTKKGKRFCPDSKGIPEEAIEKAFLESYRIMCNNNKDVLEEFLQRMEEALSSNTIHKEISKIEKEIQGLESKKNKLVDMRLENIIDKETYEEKYNSLMQEINEKVSNKRKVLIEFGRRKGY